MDTKNLPREVGRRAQIHLNYDQKRLRGTFFFVNMSEYEAAMSSTSSEKSPEMT